MTYDTFVLPIYICQLTFCAICPLVVTLMGCKYRGSNFVNSKFKVAYYNLLITLVVWSSVKIYRGVHGIIEDDLIFDMLAETDDLQLILQGVLYFLSTMVPILLLVSPMVFPSFFLSYKEQGGYKHFLQKTDSTPESSYGN